MPITESQNRNEVKKIKFHHKVKRFYYKNLFRKIYTVAILGLVAANILSMVKYQSFADEMEGLNNVPDITYYNVAGEEREIMSYNLGATSTDINDEDSWGDTYSFEVTWNDGGRGPCPEGYHVPTMNEWTNLFVQWCEDDNICDTKQINYWFEYDSENMRYNPFNYLYHLSDFNYRFNIPINRNTSNPQNITSTLHNNYDVWFFSFREDWEKGLWWNGDEGIMGKVRCFKDSETPDSIPLALDIYNDGDLIDRIFVPADQTLPGSKINKLSKYDLYDRDDEKINLNSVIFTEDDSDEGIIELDAECAQGYHEANGQCISDDAGVYYEDGYIVITDGETTYYVKDRNQGAEISLKILYDEYGIDEEDYGYEFNIMKNDEDYVKTFGNWYFWGNNSGVSYSDFFGSGGMVSLEDLAQKGFDGGRIGDNDTGWEEGATNNPCKADEGEYLPTLSDYLTAMNVWGNVKGRDNLFYTDGNSYEMYNGEGFFDDILLPQGATQMRTDSYGYYSFGDVSSMQTAKDSGGYSWMLTSSEGQHYIEYGVDHRAMPVRCFIRPEYINGNSYEVKFMDGDKELFTKKVLSGKIIKNIEEPEKQGYIFEGWYRDSGFQSEFYIDNTPITEHTILYAKWKEYGVIYGSGYIKITNGDEWVYIKDRNQGVSEDFIDKVNQIHALQNEICERKRYIPPKSLNLHVSSDGYRIFVCPDGYYTQVGNIIDIENLDDGDIQDFIRYNSIGNFYFRGNNTGVSYFDLDFNVDDYSYIENSSDLVAIGFTGGVQTEDSKGWAINPCTGQNEYLPSVADWTKAINIRSNLKEYGTGGDDSDYGGRIEFNKEFLDDIMVYGGGHIDRSYNDSEYSFRFSESDYNNELWANVSDNLVGQLRGDGYLDYNNLEYNSFVVGTAYPARCFLNLDESNEEDDTGNTSTDTPTNPGTSTPTSPSSSSSHSSGGRKAEKVKDMHNSADETNNESLESEAQDSQGTEQSSANTSQGQGNKDGSLDMSQYNSTYTPEQNSAYQFAKSHGITTTSSIKEAKMNTPLTRIEMAKMLSQYAMNVLGQTPDASRGIVKFKDVTNKMNTQYDNGVTLAYQLGIMGINMPNNEFRPNDTVTRAEFATALSRMIYGTEDGTGRVRYYEPHIARLYNEGIITNTNPKMQELRGYVMTMLMRTVK